MSASGATEGSGFRPIPQVSQDSTETAKTLNLSNTTKTVNLSGTAKTIKLFTPPPINPSEDPLPIEGSRVTHLSISQEELLKQIDEAKGRSDNTPSDLKFLTHLSKLIEFSKLAKTDDHLSKLNQACKLIDKVINSQESNIKPTNLALGQRALREVLYKTMDEGTPNELQASQSKEPVRGVETSPYDPLPKDPRKDFIQRTRENLAL